MCQVGRQAAGGMQVCSLEEIGGFERHFVSTDSSVRVFVAVRHSGRKKGIVQVAPSDEGQPRTFAQG